MKMKMTDEHYRQMTKLLDYVNTPSQVEKLKAAAEEDPLTRDVGKRLRWDLLWSVPGKDKWGWFDEVYSYCDDTHIDTALRRYMKEKNLEH